MADVKYNQPSNAPVPKVAAVGVAGAAVTLILLIGTLFGIQFQPDQVNQAVVGISALVSIITFLVGYLKRDVKPAEAVEIIQDKSESRKG